MALEQKLSLKLAQKLVMTPSLQQAIIALAGPAAGKVVVLAILMLQLASSGGTYPVPVTAGGIGGTS